MNRKIQLFFALFFILLTANTVLSHWVGRGIILAVQNTDTADESKSAELVETPALQRGGALVITNLPLFVGLGFIVRESPPTIGALYWSLVFLGSTYLPLFLSVCIFFMMHPPSHVGTFAGVEDKDPDEPAEDPDHDDNPRRR